MGEQFGSGNNSVSSVESAVVTQSNACDLEQHITIDSLITGIERTPEHVPERSPIGLFRVLVAAVDVDDGESGKEFFFEPEEWSVLIGSTSTKAWQGKTFAIKQLRKGKCVFSGHVIVR